MKNEDYLDKSNRTEVPVQSIHTAYAAANFRQKDRQEQYRLESLQPPRPVTPRRIRNMSAAYIPDLQLSQDWRTEEQFERVAGYGPGKSTYRKGDMIAPKG